jgi:hypothetical protein
MTRASAHATLIFELSALANQFFFPAFAYSAYTLTLALACHPEVDGWDVDVIAEDHHMFCKCYFAALWELAHASKELDRKILSEKNGESERNAEDEVIEIVPQVKVQPIFLPAISYLVESPDGNYLSSVWARFQQARRHSQGVVELGYVLLQYTRLFQSTGFFKIPWRTHTAIMSIVFKIHTLHITATAQCFSLIMSFITTIIPNLLRFVLAGGIWVFVQDGTSGIMQQLSTGWGALNFAQQALAASLGQVLGVTGLYSFTCWVVILDLIEGSYYTVLGQPNIVGAMPPVGEDDETAEATAEALSAETEEKKDATEAGGVPDESPPRRDIPVLTVVTGPMSWLHRIGLLFHILSDTMFVGYNAITFYALIPTSLAAWSLFRRGTDFEYIVAPKPE